jgi:two-component system, chemotaxis family, CheB/CheR fusion protein
VITEQDWTGADLAEIVGRTVARQLDHPDRLAADGPPAQLPPKMALSLSLAFHELVTNAFKYGALSSDGGRIVLNWAIEESAGLRRLKLAWREEGGPPVRAPTRKGFGSRLIERALAADLGGQVELAFEATGVVCRIDAPLEMTTSVFDDGMF